MIIEQNFKSYLTFFKYKTDIMKKLLFFCFILLATPQIQAQDLDAKEIVQKADTKFQGEKTSESDMEMTIVRPKYTRTISMTSWSKGKLHSMTLITGPANEKGQSFLKRDNDMWSYNPSISRLIKLPPSMMSQGWMGSDFSNDDILKESSIVVDYNHKLLNDEEVDGLTCYQIELLPKPDAAVVWGKIVMWITKDEFLQMKATYYDEDDYLVKTHLGKSIKNFDDRRLPSIMEIIPAEEEGNKTIVEIKRMKFNHPMKDQFFSQQNMKRLR